MLTWCERNPVEFACIVIALACFGACAWLTWG
jgi:hypothetical protein